MALPAVDMAGLLAEVKRDLNLADATHDAELVDLIEEAVDLVEVEIGPLEVLSRAELVKASGVLSRGPVVAVTAATYLGSNVLADVVLDTDSGMVSGVYVGTSVTYTYGHAVVPPRVRSVLKAMVRRAWRGTQQGGMPGYGGGGEAEAGMPPALFLSRGDLANLGRLRVHGGAGVVIA